jgi:pyrroloquinoline quinone biosynthesis protein B
MPAALAAVLALLAGTAAPMPEAKTCPVELHVLGTAQDGGAPQLGHEEDPAWADPSLRRTATSLGVFDRAAGKRWLIEATPDLREQMHRFLKATPEGRPIAPGYAGVDGVFLTHAHMGHYTGLMFFGREVMGARGLPVWTMPGMAAYLSANGPWSQLVRLENIALKPLAHQVPVELGAVTVTPIRVPHRQEYSEVVGFRIQGPGRRVLFIPDIDRWEDVLEAESSVAPSGAKEAWRDGTIEAELAAADVAYLDGTFWADGELPGRDMSKIPHPMISSSLKRFAPLPAAERAKIRFIHLNWSNPARFPDSEARRAIEAAGMGVAEEGERVCL